MWYVRVRRFVVRGCGVSNRYIDVCYCDMFSVVNSLSPGGDLSRHHLMFHRAEQRL